MKNEDELNSLASEYFISSSNLNQCRDILTRAVEIGLDFKTKEDHGSAVVNYKGQDQIMKDLLEPVPEEGKNLIDVIEEFKEKIMNGSVNFSSAHFLAFPDCGNSLAAMTGHILYGMLNQNLINSIHTSPTATFAEMSVINWLREIVGYNITMKPEAIADVGGICVTGGVSANMVGLLLARENRLPGTINTGIQCDSRKIKVFIPKGIGHYSIKAALGWMGLGKDNAVEVEITQNFTIDQNDLLKKIKSCNSDDILLALVAYTGDSRTMAVDDFEGLYKIAKQYGMWFHVDACHGLSLCFSDKLKGKIKGIELADSLTIDPHKVLFVPYTLSFVLVKDPTKFELVSGIGDLITKEPYSFGQITPLFGSRSFDSLKLWFLIKNLGKKNIGKLIEQRHEMVKYFASLINDREDFYMMNEVIINSAAYIYLPKKFKEQLDANKPDKSKKDWIVKKINKLNKNIQYRMFREGQYYVHTFQLNDFRNVLGAGRDTVFQMQRLMLGNPLTTPAVLQDFMDYLEKVAKEEVAKIEGRAAI